MRSMRFSNQCVDTKADAMLKLLDGGYLILYDGRKPETADTVVTDQTLLAILRFGTPAFSKSRNGTAQAYAFAPCLGEVFGTPTWFRALTPLGQPMFDGTVGPTALKGQQTKPQPYDMYCDDVFEGGEVIVEMIRYVEAKQ